MKTIITTNIVESLLYARNCANDLTTKIISFNPKNLILHVEIKYFTQCHPLAMVTHIISIQYVFEWKSEVNAWQSGYSFLINYKCTHITSTEGKRHQKETEWSEND